MTRKKPADWERAALRHPCHYCDAAIGEWCIARRAEPSDNLHVTRLNQVTGENYYSVRKRPVTADDA